jgi:heme/copper-type cytochrome/quinol oxidase subunit 4
MQSKNLKNKISNASVGSIINFTCFIISVVLGIVAFAIPPTGVIDSSVLMFIAEVGIFSTISKIPDFIKAVKESNTNLEITHGETTIKIDSDENK